MAVAEEGAVMSWMSVRGLVRTLLVYLRSYLVRVK